MTTPRLVLLGAACGAFLSSPGAGLAADAPSPLTLSGDLRLRYEWDWDSQNSAGVLRADRDRARARVRFNLGYKLSDEWAFGARLRTGNRQSQQSPHLTFSANDNATDDLELSLDRYYLQLKSGAFSGWAGRNTTPFWQQNELWWDEDVTPTGLAGSYERKLTQGALTTTAGAFFLPDGAVHLNGTLAGAQVKYTRPVKPATLTLAAGLYRMDGHGGARYLRNRNGARDYLLGVASAQWSTPAASGRSFVLGVDLIKNLLDYNAADAAPFPGAQADETNGYVVSALYGALKNPHDWQVGYYYAHIETFAVNAAYAQDDWARFGNGPQSDLSDIKGSEFRATYLVTKNVNLQARLFLVEAITSVQDGKRLRVDLNWRF